jgi:hypothetical protein
MDKASTDKASLLTLITFSIHGFAFKVVSSSLLLLGGSSSKIMAETGFIASYLIK